MVVLREVVAVLDELYPPARADDWDAVGTVVGDLDAEIRSVLFAVDPVQAVIDEAVRLGVDLVVTHHPLFLKGVTSVAATTPKGRVVHTLIGHGLALHTCHTNADGAALGVSASMAAALGLVDAVALRPDMPDPLDKWVVFVPHSALEQLAGAMHDAGAGVIGNYDRAMFVSAGVGSFRPLEGSSPAVGSVGRTERVDEARLEMVASRSLRERVLSAMLAAHPYEEVAYDLLESAAGPVLSGSGRVGRLAEPTTLREFAARVRAALPEHGGATRVAGDLDREIRTVALCGGSGDFLLGQARASGADVYVTSDLRHHLVSEHLEQADACAVIDVPHWAAEWTWLPVAATELRRRLGGSVTTHVCAVVTDPWTETLVRSPH